MGKEKAGFLTPKAISNRIKCKGLQKLRWYCQMCQKQCRDENGFKCHCMSESHQRQLLIAGENPRAFNDFFSNEFRNEFLNLLKRRFGTKRVHNNVVYNEYISFKEHIHMNSTKWLTLTQFTKWLGREGYCKVDETEKGWFIQYIDRDPLTLQRQKELEKQKAKEKDDDERQARAIEDMVKRGQEAGCSNDSQPEFTELKRDGDEKVAFNMQASTLSGEKSTKVTLTKTPDLLGKRKQPSTTQKQTKKKSALDEIMAAEEKKKKVSLRTENWLHAGIVVKVITKRLGEKYFKKKGVIKEVIDKFTAVVKMIESGEKLKLDQMHVETVLPAIGRKVTIVNGGYRGNTATMEAVDTKSFSATVKICAGPLDGRLVEQIKYEDISKKYEPT
ncbi:DNA/RNA-binding protein KIN17-like [Clavelina lepadiformis]|uniref:DNA/RNA-binding protein Kin17 WH-like domain-containing protein n=1 Tax=Clavelina lepadiformis TaxID=159417 RepID=A0ABP0GAU1_CLALP